MADCALNHARFRAALHPMWCRADCGMTEHNQLFRNANGGLQNEYDEWQEKVVIARNDSDEAIS